MLAFVTHQKRQLSWSAQWHEDQKIWTALTSITGKTGHVPGVAGQFQPNNQPLLHVTTNQDL